MKKLKKFELTRNEMKKIGGGSYSCAFQSPSTGNWLTFETRGHESWGDYIVTDDGPGGAEIYCTRNIDPAPPALQ